MKKLLFALVLFAVCIICAAAFAQEAQQKLLAKRAAELDAYRKLAEIIKGFEIDSETKVEDFVTESDTIHTYFRTFLKGAEMVGTPRHFEDGTCEVDMRITLERVITELNRIVKRYYKGTRYKDIAFEDIKKHTERKVVQVTGSGIPRTEKQLPEEYQDEYIDPTPSRARSPWSNDPLWKKVPAVVRLKVKRAAEVLAYRKLAEMVMGFEITSETTVEDFMTEGDVVATRLNAYLRHVKINKYTYRPDGIIEAEVEMTLERMVTELKAVKKRFYKGSRYKDVVFEDVKKYTERKIVKAIGEAPLPEKYLGIAEEEEPEPVEKTAVVEKLPDWAGNVLKAKGQGLPPEDVDSEADAYVKAKRAAELMALRKLAEMLDGVQLTSDTTVKDFKTESDKIKGEVQTFMAGFKTVSEKLLEDEVTVEVEVELHLGELYKIWKKFKKK